MCDEDRVIARIDKLDDRLLSIDTTLSAQHESLQIHIKRTDLLEQQMEPLKKQSAILNFIWKIGLALLGSGVLMTILEHIWK